MHHVEEQLGADRHVTLRTNRTHVFYAMDKIKEGKQALTFVFGIMLLSLFVELFRSCGLVVSHGIHISTPRGYPYHYITYFISLQGA